VEVSQDSRFLLLHLFLLSLLTHSALTPFSDLTKICLLPGKRKRERLLTLFLLLHYSINPSCLNEAISSFSVTLYSMTVTFPSSNWMKEGRCNINQTCKWRGNHWISLAALQEGEERRRNLLPHLVNSVLLLHFLHLLCRFHVFDPAPLPLGRALSPLVNYLKVKLRNRKSRLEKNQFDLTVSKSERFLLSPHLRDKREVFRAEVIHK